MTNDLELSFLEFRNSIALQRFAHLCEERMTTGFGAYCKDVLCPVQSIDSLSMPELA